MSKEIHKFMLGKKVGMTQVFSEDGRVIAVTVIESSGCRVVQLKTEGKEGYNAVRVGYGDVSRKNASKPNAGLFLKLGVPIQKKVKEFRVSADEVSGFNVGQMIEIGDMFKPGDKINVSGISKGKGFQGCIKRHGQSRGPETHGSNHHRRPGLMGANSYPARVFKGKKLPGRMGGTMVTVQNLEVIGIDKDNGLMWIKGAIPGPNGSWISISDSVKSVV